MEKSTLEKAKKIMIKEGFEFAKTISRCSEASRNWLIEERGRALKDYYGEDFAEAFKLGAYTENTSINNYDNLESNKNRTL